MVAGVPQITHRRSIPGIGVLGILSAPWHRCRLRTPCWLDRTKPNPHDRIGIDHLQVADYFLLHDLPLDAGWSITAHLTPSMRAD